MKRVIALFVLVGMCISTANTSLFAQAKKKKATAKKYNTKKAKPKTPAIVEVPVDTTSKVVINVSNDSIPLGKVMPSLRNNSAVDRNLIKDKTPLAYEYIREDDQLYKQIIWRNINTKEKMNLPFRYDADEDNGNQRFINILLQAVQNGEITAFSGLNDRFTTPMKLGDIKATLVEPDVVSQIIDREKDPDGSKGIFKDTVVRNEFNPNIIESYQVKEEVIFDKESSRLHFRIIGIAPLKQSVDASGNLRGEPFPIFWVYYPDIRPLLSKYEAYNPKNSANRLSWEEIFESHYFASYIVKSSLNNPYDKPLSFYVSDPLLRLVEGENVKDAIFNFEQNQWSY